jgi:hypothetical protein
MNKSAIVIAQSGVQAEANKIETPETTKPLTSFEIRGLCLLNVAVKERFEPQQQRHEGNHTGAALGGDRDHRRRRHRLLGA